MQNVDYSQTCLFEYYPVFVCLFLVRNWGCQGHLYYLLNYKEVLQTNFLVVLFILLKIGTINVIQMYYNLNVKRKED